MPLIYDISAIAISMVAVFATVSVYSSWYQSHKWLTLSLSLSLSLRFNGHFPGGPGLAGVY